MGSLYRSLIRPLLFRMDPERAHHLAIWALKTAQMIPGLIPMMSCWNRCAEAKPVTLFGVTFPNRIGLAAGFDKNAEIWRAASGLGFGHVEIGTVTGEGQSGNPRPRMFRYPEQQAVLNRMGFNNEGAETVAKRLSRQIGRGKRHIRLGINLGKTKVVPLEEASQDYLKSFRLLAPLADYVTLNVSSPNTPGLRGLQEAGPLRELLSAVQQENWNMTRQQGERQPLPVLLKIAPDLTFSQIDEILEIVQECRIAGIIATNTTLKREGPFADLQESGGLSGSPVFTQALNIVGYIARQTAGRLPIVAVGGVSNETQAAAMMNAGASLVQIYTSMIFEGPFLAPRLAQALSSRDRNWVYS